MRVVIADDEPLARERLRSLLAAQALRSTQRPIFDIAMDLGYVSQQTFSRVFRREFDRTPSDYRHQLN